MLEPQGPNAAHITNLWWLLFWMATAVFIFVMGFLLLALFRHSLFQDAHTQDQHTQIDESTTTRRGTRVVLLTGIVAPILILLVVFGATIWTLRALATPAIAEDLTIHVIGRRWWWEVQYPTQQFATANEIHIPAGRPVRIVLSSSNVIHSFWVPELQGKMDLVPGNVNSLWLQADEPGVYRGECAEFCGIQHAKMNFLVIAQPQADYDAWLAQQQQPAPQPTEELAQLGQQIFFKADCMECHTVRGTDATGKLGPDLTHLASRRTLGSATIENTLGDLGGWVSNPQHVKPGSLMPPTPLTGVELQALLAYLVTLK
ncbi:MAG: cytochrome c oxidase subunit II [Caldilineaceae bacterium]